MTIPAHRIPAFWEKVDRASDDGCWEWLGAKNGGYGRFHLRSQGPGRATAAHRVSYELLVGPIPDGLTLDHLCRNRGCVNPAHLEPVTNKTNILRGESFAADHAQRTHCPQGHEYTPENTYWRGGKRPGRECRECHRQWGIEHRKKLARKRLAGEIPTRPPRSIHAWHPAGEQIVRTHPSGRWFIELVEPSMHAGLTQQVTLDEAAARALQLTEDGSGEIWLGIPGGAFFDRLIQRERTETTGA